MELNIVRIYTAVSGVDYIVVEKNSTYFQIFKIETGTYGKKTKVFITHKDNLKSAKKLAKLLANTYSEGFGHGAY